MLHARHGSDLAGVGGRPGACCARTLGSDIACCTPTTSDQLGGHHLALGYNREDILAELLFCLINGRRPMPFPVRRMNAVDCVLPVWDIPKSLLDACYPAYSESNYTERVDTTTVQRSSIYFIAHCLDALVPQLSISLLRGIARLMDDLDGWQPLRPIDGTPLMRTGHADPTAEADLIATLRRFFPIVATGLIVQPGRQRQ